MSYRNPIQLPAKAALILVLSAPIAAPMSLEEFNKIPRAEQGSYVSAAVGMAAYIAAADGEAARSRCIRRWYFGTREQVGKGIEEIATEIMIAERVDAKKYHIEGVILGLVEKACGPSSRANAARQPN